MELDKIQKGFSMIEQIIKDQSEAIAHQKECIIHAILTKGLGLEWTEETLRRITRVTHAEDVDGIQWYYLDYQTEDQVLLAGLAVEIGQPRFDLTEDFIDQNHFPRALLNVHSEFSEAVQAYTSEYGLKSGVVDYAQDDDVLRLFDKIKSVAPKRLRGFNHNRDQDNTKNES